MERSTSTAPLIDQIPSPIHQSVRQSLRTYVGNGGTVVLSSHVMEVVESLCDHVAVMAEAQVRAAGPLDEVRAGRNLQDRFIELVGGGRDEVEGLEWLRT